MTAQRAAKENTRHIAAFIAGGIFYLAGTICIVMAVSPRQAVPLFLGAMLICGGSVWVVIGAKFKKEAEQR